MPGLAPARLTIAAGETEVINARGSLCFLRRVLDGIPSEYGGTGQDANQDVEVELAVKGSGESYKVRMAGSEKIRPAAEFYEVRVTNPQAAALWVEFYIGVGDFFRPVADIVNVSVSKPSATQLESLIDFTEVGADFGQGNGNAGEAFDPADYPGFIKAWVHAHPDNSDYLRIGDTNVDTDQGQVLQAGDTVVWDTEEPCNVCSEGATGDGVLAVTILSEP